MLREVVVRIGAFLLLETASVLAAAIGLSAMGAVTRWGSFVDKLGSLSLALAGLALLVLGVVGALAGIVALFVDSDPSPEGDR